MTIDIGVEIFIEIKQVRQDEPEFLKAADGISTSQPPSLPAALPIAPAQLTAFHIFQPSLGRWEIPTRAETKLALVLLPEPEMQTEAEHQKGSNGFGDRSRVAVSFNMASASAASFF